MVHEQAAGFALDALDPAEASDFEQHLRMCPDCEDELERLHSAAAALAFAGRLDLPRPELRLRVLNVRSGLVIPFGRRWTMPIVSAAAAAAACAVIVIGLNGFPGGRPPVAGLKTYPLHGSEGSLLVGRRGEAMLVVEGLPAPATGTTYEVWVVRDGRPLAAGFLHGRLGKLSRPVPSGASVAVSLEPVGGSRRPTGPLLLQADTA